ncbi:hypothetical protein ACFL09_03970 [Planctomycetota bacterium]
MLMRAALLTLAMALSAAAGELVPDGAMEPPFANGLPRGWAANCWGRNAVSFSQGAPHGGKASLQVTCTAFESGAAQFLYLITGAAEAKALHKALRGASLLQ